MKKSKIIAPALGVLVLSTAASISGTVAWFTANSAVSVKGMVVSTKVGSNLLIQTDTLDSTAKIAASNFTDGITQSSTNTLEPVSTRDGVHFFYTTDAKADGDANADVYTAYNAAEVPTSGVGSELEAFNTAYGTTGAVGYVDYIFQLRAVNTQNASKAIKMTKLDLIYQGAKDNGNAWRVAMFSEDISSSNLFTIHHLNFDNTDIKKQF